MLGFLLSFLLLFTLLCRFLKFTTYSFLSSFFSFLFYKSIFCFVLCISYLSSMYKLWRVRQSKQPWLVILKLLNLKRIYYNFSRYISIYISKPNIWGVKCFLRGRGEVSFLKNRNIFFFIFYIPLLKHIPYIFFF